MATAKLPKHRTTRKSISTQQQARGQKRAASALFDLSPRFMSIMELGNTYTEGSDPVTVETFAAAVVGIADSIISAMQGAELLDGGKLYSTEGGSLATQADYLLTSLSRLLDVISCASDELDGITQCAVGMMTVTMAREAGREIDRAIKALDASAGACGFNDADFSITPQRG